MRFSRSTEAVSKPFGGEIARGKHLFPFRTEPLSLSAPMVLGGQPPGRVGRRRSYLGPPPRGGSFSFGAVSSTPGGPSARVSEHSTENQRTERPARAPPTTSVAARGAALSSWVSDGPEPRAPVRRRSAPELLRDRAASGAIPRRGRTACSHRREAARARSRTPPKSRSRSLRRRRRAAALGYL
jgi:hypothetical protein